MKTSLSTCRIDFAAFYFDCRDHAACACQRQGACGRRRPRAGLNDDIFRKTE
jgi:hypothetical protein